MDFILTILIIVYIVLSVKAIRKLEKRVDNQAKFIADFIGVRQSELQQDNHKEVTTVDKVN